MNQDDRTTKLEAAFADPSDGHTKVGSIHLRPFSLGTLNLCRRLNLTLFLDEEADLTDEEKQRQIVAFAWAQSAPLPEVLAALRTNMADEKIEEFEFGLAVGDLPALLDEIQRIGELAAASTVDVAPKPGTSGEEGTPPN